MEMTIVLLIIIIGVALLFEYINGFHDSANAISRVVSTKALSARHAILYASFLNFLGALCGTHVAKTIGSGIVVLASDKDDKASIVVGVTPDLTDKYSAVDFVRAASGVVGGKGGGGRPDMAQAGGPDVSKIEEAFETIKSMI